MFDNHSPSIVRAHISCKVPLHLLPWHKWLRALGGMHEARKTVAAPGSMEPQEKKVTAEEWEHRENSRSDSGSVVPAGRSAPSFPLSVLPVLRSFGPGTPAAPPPRQPLNPSMSAWPNGLYSSPGVAASFRSVPQLPRY